MANALPADVDRIYTTHGTNAARSTARRLIKIRIEDTLSNPHNPRVFYHPQTILALASSFASQGQLDAIKVTQLPEHPEIVTEVVEEMLDPKSLYLRAYHANRDRDEQTHYDDAYAWKKLLDRRVYRDQNELAIAVGRNLKHVNKVLQLTTLPNILLEEMAAHVDVVKLSHAYNLKLIFDRSGESVAAHWLKAVISGTVSVRKLEQITSNESKIPNSGRQKIHYQSKFPLRLSDGTEIGMLKQFADGRTELTIVGVTGNDQLALSEKIKAMVSDWALSVRLLKADQ